MQERHKERRRLLKNRKIFLLWCWQYLFNFDSNTKHIGNWRQKIASKINEMSKLLHSEGNGQQNAKLTSGVEKYLQSLYLKVSITYKLINNLIATSNNLCPCQGQYCCVKLWPKAAWREKHLFQLTVTYHTSTLRKAPFPNFLMHFYIEIIRSWIISMLFSHASSLYFLHK